MDDIEPRRQGGDRIEAEARVQRALDWQIPVEEFYTALKELAVATARAVSGLPEVADIQVARF
jgi:hypothetical protein